MILAIFNCFSIPFQVAFEPEVMDTLEFRLSNNVIDILFFIDLIVNFRTTFIHSKTGNEIASGKKIATNYLRGRFWIDLIATIPLDNIAELIMHRNTNLLSVFSIMKLVRVLRLNRIIVLMKVESDIKLSLKLFKLVFFLVMYIH